MISLVRVSIFFAVSFLISFLLLPVIVKVFKQWKWYDVPGTHKIHADHVPSMGGVAILIGAILTLLMSLPLQQWIELKYFFISTVIVFIIGLRDDLLALTPKQKLFGQFLPVFVLIFLANTRLQSWYGLFGSQISFNSIVSISISFLTVIIITNAYNLIDGIDGLAGTIGFLAMTFFGIWFCLVGKPSTGLLALCFAGPLLAFLFFNWEPSKIFMGDTGALMIGLILSYFSINFIDENYSLPIGHYARFESSVSTAICILIVPVFDTLRVIILRLRKLQSPFRADRNHLHHQFLALGKSHGTATKWIGLINIFFIGLAIVLKSQPDYVILPIVILICFMINFVLRWRLTSKKNSIYNA